MTKITSMNGQKTGSTEGAVHRQTVAAPNFCVSDIFCRGFWRNCEVILRAGRFLVRLRGF